MSDDDHTMPAINQFLKMSAAVDAYISLKY